QNCIYDSEPLPAAITLDEALAEGAPLVWPEGVPSSDANDTGAHGADVGSAKHEQKTHSNIAATTEYTRGDAAAAFAAAEVVVEGTYHTPIVHQGAIDRKSTRLNSSHT